MSALQNKTSGRLGKLFMGVVCLLGIAISLMAFMVDRFSVQARNDIRVANETSQMAQQIRSRRNSQANTSNSPYASEEATSTFVVHDQGRGEEAANKLAVREKVFEAKSAEFWQPNRAPEGGYDIERSIDRAANAIAKRICDDAHERARRDWEIDTIAISPDPNTGDSTTNRKIVRRVASQIRVLTNLYVAEDEELISSQLYLVSGQMRSGWGRVIEAVSDDKRFGVSVIVDDKMLPMLEIPKNWEGRWEISFHTDNQMSAEFSRADALDGLYARIATRLWIIARSENDVAPEDKDEFMMLVRRHYPLDLLVGMGRRALQPIRVIMEDEAGNADAVYYQTEVVWSGKNNQLRGYSDAIADMIRTRKRAPFVRLGLSLGLCILSLLTWLRVDWWLKGHYSLMNKVTFVTLTAFFVAVVWNYPLHG